MRPEVSGFMATEFISGLPLDNHSSSGSFLAVRALLSQDGFQQGGFWEGTWTGGSGLLLSFFFQLLVVGH